MATIRDVSKESGLSTATVSLALSAPEKVSKKSLAKIQKAIDKLQYSPNMLSQRFRNRRSDTLVVLVPNIANSFFIPVIKGIEAVAHREGFQVLIGDISNSSRREKELINLVETRLADGLIQLSAQSDNLDQLAQKNLLAVCAAGSGGAVFPSVTIDNIAASKAVVDYLISNGHRRIGVIAGPKDNANTHLRLEGYKQSLSAAGITYDPNLVVEGDFRLLSGVNAALHMSSMNADIRPSAVFAMNDEMAIGAMKGFRQRGLSVPSDVSIIGFDNLEMSRYTYPALTTISQPANALGEKSAEILIRQIKGEVMNQLDFLLPYEFIIRDSVVKLA